MKRYGFYLVIAAALVLSAYRVAQNKIAEPLKLEAVHLGMTAQEVEKNFGIPSAQTRNQFIYILHDGSELILTLRENKVSSASAKFHRPIKIEDPEMRRLTLVQMDSNVLQDSNPSWFFAGKPEDGLIYKITSTGQIESITWVPPFSYGTTQPKKLQALIRDFKSQRSL